MAEPTERGAALTKLRLTVAVAEKRIHALARASEDVQWSFHALERMREREITDIQVLEILRSGMVVGKPELTASGEWQCKMVKELRGRRKAGVVTIILHAGRLFLKTVEWEDTK